MCKSLVLIRNGLFALSENQEFIFSGIINSCDLLNEQKERITDWLKKLVPVFALKGLNSLDFIQADDKSLVLEINPRPSASMQLYDADLLSRHIKASLGELADYCSHAGYTGYQIVYAEQDVIIPDGFEWPMGAWIYLKAGAYVSQDSRFAVLLPTKNKRSLS